MQESLVFARTSEPIGGDFHTIDSPIVSLNRVLRDNCPSLPAFVEQVFEQASQRTVRSFSELVSFPPPGHVPNKGWSPRNQGLSAPGALDYVDLIVIDAALLLRGTTTD